MLTNGVHNLIKLKRKETTLIGLSCGKPRKEYNGNVLSLKYDYFFLGILGLLWFVNVKVCRNGIIC